MQNRPMCTWYSRAFFCHTRHCCRPCLLAYLSEKHDKILFWDIDWTRSAYMPHFSMYTAVDGAHRASHMIFTWVSHHVTHFARRLRPTLPRICLTSGSRYPTSDQLNQCCTWHRTLRWFGLGVLAFKGHPRIPFEPENPSESVSTPINFSNIVRPGPSMTVSWNLYMALETVRAIHLGLKQCYYRRSQSSEATQAFISNITVPS